MRQGDFLGLTRHAQEESKVAHENDIKKLFCYRYMDKNYITRGVGTK